MYCTVKNKMALIGSLLDVIVPEVKECERLFSLVQPWTVDTEDGFCLKDSPWESNSSSTEKKKNKTQKMNHSTSTVQGQTVQVSNKVLEVRNYVTKVEMTKSRELNRSASPEIESRWQQTDVTMPHNVCMKLCSVPESTTAPFWIFKHLSCKLFIYYLH